MTRFHELLLSEFKVEWKWKQFGFCDIVLNFKGFGWAGLDDFVMYVCNIDACDIGLHDISFQHRYHDVHIRNSHIAGCAMFSRPILFVICIYTDCFLCSHTDTASTPDATAVQRYPFLNKFSSRATARFQCWKSINPLLKLPRCRGERWSRLLSNGRSHESASSRALWKGEKTGVFHAFLATTCERPMAPKSVYTGRDKATVTNHLNFCVSMS